MSERIDHARFVDLLAEHLPEVAARISQYARGLPHPEMGIPFHCIFVLKRSPTLPQ